MKFTFLPAEHLPPSPLARPRPSTGPAARSRSTAPDLSHAAAPDARARCRQSCVTGAGRGRGEESLKSPDSQLCRTRQAGRPQTDRQTDARAPDAGKPGSLNPRAFRASSSSLLPFPASTEPSLPGTLIPSTVSAAPLFNPASWCLAVAGGTMRPELPVTATHSATPGAHTEDTECSLLLLTKGEKKRAKLRSGNSQGDSSWC